MTDKGNLPSLPPIAQILDDFTPDTNQTEVRTQALLIEKTLADFGIVAQVRNFHCGPRLTRFSLKPETAKQISQIKRLEKDLAVALSGTLTRLEEPRQDYPYLGLVVENYRKPEVKLRQILESSLFEQHRGQVKIGLGLNTFAQPMVIDLAALPHLLIGGATGSGKSVCLHAILAGLLCTYPPAALQLLLIDPLQVELERYNGLPHLVTPVVSQPSQILEALEAIIEGMEQRYRHMAQFQARDIAAYNQKAAQIGQKQMPAMVVIIDNLFDLMMNAPKEVEQALTRIAQKARGAGVHLVLATLRSSVSTVSGAIKANFPARIAFKVADSAESRLILDSGGAEKLLGEGDMFYKAPHTSLLERVQGVYVSEAELERLLRFWKNRQKKR